MLNKHIKISIHHFKFTGDISKSIENLKISTQKHTHMLKDFFERNHFRYSLGTSQLATMAINQVSLAVAM